MTPSPSAEVTRLLRAWGQVDDQALEKLTPMVYQELRRLARHYMRGERDGHTLQTTALVNEAYLRLVDATGVEWQDRAHFFAVSAQMMRRILVDAGRGDTARQPGRCPGRRLQQSECELVALDDALAALAEFDPHKAKVVELRFFGGLSVEETAEVLKISPQSVMRDWKLARAWLMRELSRGS